MTDALVDLLDAAANENTMLARVLRHVKDKPVCPHPRDFYAALKHDPAIVVRLRASMPGERKLPIDCRYRNGAVEFCHEYRDVGLTGRDQFIADVRDADEVEVLHHDDSQFDDDSDASTPQVRADGCGAGVAVDLDARTEAELDLDVLVSLHQEIDWAVVPGIKSVDAARWTEQLQQAHSRLAQNEQGWSA